MKARRSKKPGKVILELGRSDERLLASANATANASRPRFAINRILVPIDFSDCSRKALRYAIPLAKEHAASITLLYVVPTQYATYDYGGPNMPMLEARMFVDAEKQLKEMLEEECDDVTAHSLVRTGSPAEQILSAANEIPADIIIISTHGRTGFKHIVMGSVAEQVVRRATCPTLVVRENEHEFILE
jgi:universal stress protein A